MGPLWCNYLTLGQTPVHPSSWWWTHCSRAVLCLLTAKHTQVLGGCSLFTFNKSSTEQGKVTNSQHYLLFWMLHKPLRNWRSLSWVCCAWQRPWKVDVWLWHQVAVRKIRRALKIYIVAHPLKLSPQNNTRYTRYILHNHRKHVHTHMHKATTTANKQ